MERWFNVDLSQRPPINAKKSFDAFEELLKKYPHSQYVGDARQRMIFLRNRLADFELYVARYDMREGPTSVRSIAPSFASRITTARPRSRAPLRSWSMPTGTQYDGSRGQRRTRLHRQLSGQCQGHTDKKSWWRRIL